MSAVSENKPSFARFLTVNDPSKQWIADRISGLMDSSTVVPSLSIAAVKLSNAVKGDGADMDEVSRIISMDPGLTMRCLKVASSSAYSYGSVDSIDQAVMMIGMRQIRNIAFTVGVVDGFQKLRIHVDWRRFWLHSILVGRLTEVVASVFREPIGFEYISGLLHDVGNLVIEHDFPREFESIMLEAMERRCGHDVLERRKLGIDHTQIGAALCDNMKLGKDTIYGVRYHHDPLNPRSIERPLGDEGFLACCIALADTLTGIADVNLDRFKDYSSDFQDLPEWQHLSRWQMLAPLEIDMKKQIEKAEGDLAAMGC